MLNVKEMPWNRVVGDGWATRLKTILHSKGMQDLMDFVVAENQLSLIYPKQQDIFRAFRLCSPDRMKVIILGQDPYHDGSATGLTIVTIIIVYLFYEKQKMQKVLIGKRY